MRRGERCAVHCSAERLREGSTVELPAGTQGLDPRQYMLATIHGDILYLDLRTT